jgi:arylsulfatase A-like enzyme
VERTGIRLRRALRPGRPALGPPPWLARLGLAIGLALSALALPGCAAEEPWLEAPQRLADLLHPPRAAWRRPAAVLDDVRRTVLWAPTQAALVRRGAAVVRPDGGLRISERLPGPLRRADRLVLAPRVLFDGGEWTSLPARVVRPAERLRGRELPVELELGRERAGQPVRLLLDALEPPPGPEQRIETPAIVVPPQARLDFAIGVLPAAWPQGPVRFELAVCEGERCQSRFEARLDPDEAEGRSWNERAVDLADLAGRSVRLRFDARLERPGPDAFSLPLWANPTVRVAAERRPEALNVILLSLDTLRADRLPTYGHPLATAPFLDSLASRGTVFESFTAAATTTAPSHMTLFTSIEPSVLHRLSGLGRIWPRATTLAEALRGAGFETAAINENVVLDAERGFARGFDFYRENKSVEVLEGGGDAARTYAMAKQFLAAHTDRRFFLFLHTYQVHYPYVPEPGYEALFPEPPAGAEPRPGLPPDRDPALYDREIRFLDDQIRELVAALEEHGLAERTLLVITSDHGEEFLEHGGIGHAANLHAEVTEVPLILVGPGIPEGRRVSQAFGHRDLMPTLLEWLGVPTPATVRGRSFAALLGPEPGRLAPAPVYTESWRRPSAKRGDPGVAVRLGGRKLIRDPRDGEVVYRYFRVDEDPLEREDRAAAAAGEAAALRRDLEAYRGEARRVAATLRGRHGAGPEDREVVPEVKPDLLQEERLRALGYVE